MCDLLIGHTHFLQHRKCHVKLGAEDKQRWEDIIFSFLDAGQLPVRLADGCVLEDGQHLHTHTHARTHTHTHTHTHTYIQVILPFIPVRNPQLSPAIYELVLNNYLEEDCKVSINKALSYALTSLTCSLSPPQTLYKVIEEWSNTLYNPQAIITAVEVRVHSLVPRPPQA